MRQLWRWTNESAVLFPIIFFGIPFLGLYLASNFESILNLIGMILFWGWVVLIVGTLVLGTVIRFFTEGF